MRDLSLQFFGRLFAIEPCRNPKTQRKQIYWWCHCECGNFTIVSGNRLHSGVTTSCGCLQRESASKINTTHGWSGTPLYASWFMMHARCYNANNKSHKYYASKNIQVCSEWHDAETFVTWALENGWQEGLQLDRIDPTKDYCPENCQWMTKSDHTSKTNLDMGHRLRKGRERS